MTALLNPRYVRVVALPAPTERERTQWYFQRYIAHLPSAGEMVLFGRSWYNRAGVERVMGFCTDEEYDEFMRTCPQFERMLVRAGIVLIKYWLSVSDDEQERRFLGRINDPSKRWKLSPMDLQARARWVDYSEAKDQMFAYTDIPDAPWHVVETDNKRAAHLNLISHFLSLIPYEERSEEHTSELQSQSNLVCRLLLEKKKNYIIRDMLGSKSKTQPKIKEFALSFNIHPNIQKPVMPGAYRFQGSDTGMRITLAGNGGS